MSDHKPIAPCEYVGNVGCAKEGRRCDKCGWNPVVSAKRLENIRKKMEGKA